MELLHIYLNDHLAGSTVGVELVKRAATNNRGNEYGALLDRLASEIEEDRNTLRSLMQELGVRENHLKVAGAWSAEKLGRLKLNGRLVGYSPLSRVVELEGMMLGVTGKLGLWRALDALKPREPRLANVDLQALIARANRQQDELEEQRIRAARDAFG